jgi:hypothetical protein
MLPQFSGREVIIPKGWERVLVGRKEKSIEDWPFLSSCGERSWGLPCIGTQYPHYACLLTSAPVGRVHISSLAHPLEYTNSKSINQTAATTNTRALLCESPLNLLPLRICANAVDEEELKAAFEFFDVHKRGVLTPADLKQRLGVFYKNLPAREYKFLIRYSP